MENPPENKTLDDLINSACCLNRTIDSYREELKTIKEQIIARAGKGRHVSSAGFAVLVVVPSPAIKPDEGAIATVKTLAGKLFGKLFAKTVVYTPVKSFRDVALALFPPRKAEQIIVACEVPTEPYVKIEK